MTPPPLLPSEKGKKAGGSPIALPKKEIKILCEG